MFRQRFEQRRQTLPTLNQSQIKLNTMGVGHYENFPVASLLLPKAYRPAVQALYRFARTADDLADEGDATPEQRLIALKDYEQALTRLEEQTEAVLPPTLQPVFLPLADVVRRYHLPVPLLRDLLDAFKQDVTTQRYATYTDLLDYCACSRFGRPSLPFPTSTILHSGSLHS